MNCGCEQRKQIMFDQGNPGLIEAIIVGVAILAVVAAIIYRKTPA